MAGKFENILIVSDMDGTYLAGNEKGDRRNREAIEYFKSNGGHFTFATGRSVMHFFMAQEGVEKVADLPIICCNGAFLYDVRADREIAVYPMEHKLVYEIQRKFSELEETVDSCHGASSQFKSVFFKSKASKATVDDYKNARFKRDVYELMSPEEWEGYDIHKIIFVGDAEPITSIRSYLDPLVCDRADISQASPRYYEFNALGVNKASGIQNLLKLCFPDRKMTVCAVGDYDNDIKMIEYATLGCCPENANDRVKAASDKVFCHHSEGVIADIVEYFEKNI